jgi:hypothetical protein
LLRVTESNTNVDEAGSAPANSIDLRYSLPDSGDGAGLNSTAGLYVNGVKNHDLNLTSRYSWYYGSYPFTNRPGDGHGHHFYDETRALLGSSLPAGTEIKVQIDSGSGNAVDGDANSYWESTNNSFPQSLTVDLSSAPSVSKIVLKLPPASAWGTRTQTLSVLGSTDGANYSTVKSSAGYTFNPGTGNTATITFPATSQRYLR